MSECYHPTLPATECVFLSVDQFVSQFIELNNFSVSKWMSAATTTPTPYPVCVLLQSTSL